MQQKNLAEIASQVVALLTSLETDERRRVLSAALTLLGDNPVFVSKDQKQTEKDAAGDEASGLPPNAQLWMKQNVLTAEEISQVFHLADGATNVIAAEIPGKNNKERVLNAYVITGLAKLLSTGESNFDDKTARELCEASGFYDHTNHAKYMKEKGNLFTGSKDSGWTLTAPGKKHGAALVKGLSNSGQ